MPSIDRRRFTLKQYCSAVVSATSTNSVRPTTQVTSSAYMDTDGKRTIPMPQPVHEPFSKSCMLTDCAIFIAQPSLLTTPDQWSSTAEERVCNLPSLPSSYLRRTMLHSHIVHSASSGVTAHKGISHQGAAGTDWHLTCFEPVTTTKLHADVQYLSSQQSDSSHGAIIPKPSIESHEYHIRSIERFLCFTCEDPTPRGYRPATPRHQCDQPIRLHEWLRPFFQASLSKHLD